MFSSLLIIVLFGMVVYYYVEERYFKIKLNKKTVELKKAKEKKKEEGLKCPAHFANHSNECRYNIHMKRFTCQFNPKHLSNSGYFYNSPDICCNNRCKELNKILDVVLEKRNSVPKGTQKVWCPTDGDVHCRSFNSRDGTCPADALSNQSVPAFGSKDACVSYSQKTVCHGRGREDCFNTSNCVWMDADNSVKGGKCVFGTPSGPYNATKDASVGYINGSVTAVAGNTNPYFMVSTFKKSEAN